jgi:TatD DNase family protein
MGKKYGLPMFLHSRHPDAHRDFVRVMKEVGYEEGLGGWVGGVVHSFTGTKAEMGELASLSLYS